MTESKTVATAPPEEIDSSAGHSIPSYFTRESLFIALAGLLVYATLAAYLQNRGVFLGDAVSRTAAAFYVLFSRDPHLAAIGFVWSPLSTAVQIPIVFVFNVFHIDLTLAGRLTSVVAASGTLALLNTFFLGSGIKPRPRYLLVALYGLNPMVMLYAANAMSESLFIFLLVLITISFVWWARTGSIARFTHMTFAAMFALLTRYEALPLIAGVAFCLMPIMAPLARTFGVMPTVRRVEAHLIAFIFATAYSFGIWVYFNWQIMGNPLFFLQSIYGHVSIVRAMERALEAVDPAIGSIPLSLAYSFGQTLWLAPALVVVLPAAAVVVVVRRNVTLFCVLLLAMTIPLFQAYEIYAGDSPKWLRLFMYAIPFVYLLLGFVTSEVSRLLSGWRVRVAWSVTAVVLLISNAGAFFAMQQPDTAQGEWEVVTVLLNPGGPVPPSYSLTTDFEVAGYLKALRDDEALILDSSMGDGILVAEPGPVRHVITSDRDFEKILSSPFGNVTHLLVPDPSVGGIPDRLNVEFPGLWDDPIPTWLELEREFPSEPEIWIVSRVRDSFATIRYIYEREGAGADVIVGARQIVPLVAINDPIAEPVLVRQHAPMRWRLFRMVEPRPGS